MQLQEYRKHFMIFINCNIPEGCKKKHQMVGKSFLIFIFFDHDPDNSVFCSIIFSTEENFKKCPNAIIGMEMTHFRVPHLFLLDCILFVEFDH